jgi:hypothetical protein
MINMERMTGIEPAFPAWESLQHRTRTSTQEIAPPTVAEGLTDGSAGMLSVTRPPPHAP